MSWNDYWRGLGDLWNHCAHSSIPAGLGQPNSPEVGGGQNQNSRRPGRSDSSAQICFYLMGRLMNNHSDKVPFPLCLGEGQLL